MAKKVYVDTTVHFDADGRMIPLSVTWSDGRIFAVDRVLDVCRAASLKAGGQGIRYTCRIAGKITYLYFEDPQWFVEAKE